VFLSSRTRVIFTIFVFVPRFPFFVIPLLSLSTRACRLFDFDTPSTVQRSHEGSLQTSRAARSVHSYRDHCLLLHRRHPRLLLHPLCYQAFVIPRPYSFDIRSADARTRPRALPTEGMVGCQGVCVLSRCQGKSRYSARSSAARIHPGAA